MSDNELFEKIIKDRSDDIKVIAAVLDRKSNNSGDKI